MPKIPGCKTEGRAAGAKMTKAPEGALVNDSPMASQFLHALAVFVRACVDFNLVAGLHEQRNRNLEAGGELR